MKGEGGGSVQRETPMREADLSVRREAEMCVMVALEGLPPRVERLGQNEGLL